MYCTYMAPMGTKLRNIRVPDEIWEPALHKAEAEGTTLSERIREFLAAYAQEDSQ